MADKQLGERDRFFAYWLLRAYFSGQREGWEDGPSVQEVMTGLLHVLANLGFDPALNGPDVRALLARDPGTVAPSTDAGDLAARLRSVFGSLTHDENAAANAADEMAAILAARFEQA